MSRANKIAFGLIAILGVQIGVLITVMVYTSPLHR